LGRLEKLAMRVCHGPFYNGLSKILERKATLLSILAPEVKMFGLKNNGMTSQLLGRFIGVKLKKGFTIMELMNPIRKELLIVKKEEKGFHGFKFKFKGRFKRRNRSKKIVFGGGKMPLATISVYIDYNFSTIILRNSICGIKV
jgi:ribosomal protein S3